ncbi:MAG TPA: hypothetical protein VJV79_02890 [Polyangiaceae bacterium]|nr:hypothetical protein [Polyangiaceae bacterium]
MLATSRFPRAAAVIEILALAELFRTAAAGLEALTESGPGGEPAALRVAAHELVRTTVGELEGQVSL